DPANDAPIVTAAAAAAYTENNPGTPVDDTTLTVVDPDSANLTGATVTITAASENPTTFDFDQTRSIDWQVTDGITPSAIATTTLTITPLNDQPDVDAPAQLGGPAGATITISNIIFSDIDGGESPQTEVA